MTEVDSIETPENVVLQRRLAGIGSRFIAGLIDSLIIFAMGLVILFVFGFMGVLDASDVSPGARAWLVAVLFVVFFAVYWGYFVFFEMLTNGQSPGKKVEKIRVVKAGGGAIAFTDIAIRNLLRVVDGLVFYAVAGICMFFTKKAQRLGDLAAGTVVISEAISDYAARSGRRSKAQWQWEATAEVLRATNLSPEEYRALSNYWMRRNELTLPAREQLLRTLVLPILRRISPDAADESLASLEYHLEVLMRKALAAEQSANKASDIQGAEL